MSLIDSLEDGQVHVITERDASLPWSGKRTLPRCGLCRRRLKVGMQARWQWVRQPSTSSVRAELADWRGGNFFVCATCDLDFESSVRKRIAKVALRAIVGAGGSDGK